MKRLLIHIFSLIILTTLVSCELLVDIVSNDDIDTTIYPIVNSLDKIEIVNDIDLELIESEDSLITITGAKDIMDKIEFRYASNVLNISYKSSKSWMYDKPQMQLRLPQICDIQVFADNEIFANDTIRTDEFKIESEGTGDIKLNLNTKTIHIKAAYTCNCYLSGKTENLMLETYYGSIFYGENLKAVNIESTCAGSNHQYLYPLESLNCNIKLNGNIYYINKPENLQINTSPGSSGKAIYKTINE